MSIEEKELVADFVAASKENLADLKEQILAIEKLNGDVDVDLLQGLYREIHSIQGAAGFLGLSSVSHLSQSLENVLTKMRDRELSPSPQVVAVILRSANRLEGLLSDVENSNQVDIGHHIEVLERITQGDEVAVPAAAVPESAASQSNGGMRQ